MKRFLQLTICCVAVIIFTKEVLASGTAQTFLSAHAPAHQDDAQARTDLYKKFIDNMQTSQPVAYEAGKEYLRKYEAKDGPDDQYVKYVKKWVTAYEKFTRRNQLLQQLKDKNYDAAFAAGRQVLADIPDDLTVLYELSKAGLFAAAGGNEAYNADAVGYAKRTIQLIQSGKTLEKDKPIENKDEILGGLNYVLGFLVRKSQPSEAVNYFASAAQFEGFAKRDPQTYVLLADAYETGEYTKRAGQFNTNCKTEDRLKAQDCMNLKAQADQLVDRIIDALARAIAYSNVGPDATKYERARATWVEAISRYYKYRNDGSDAGLKELIAGVLSRPLPKPAGQSSP